MTLPLALCLPLSYRFSLPEPQKKWELSKSISEPVSKVFDTIFPSEKGVGWNIQLQTDNVNSEVSNILFSVMFFKDVTQAFSSDWFADLKASSYIMA